MDKMTEDNWRIGDPKVMPNTKSAPGAGGKMFWVCKGGGGQKKSATGHHKQPIQF